MLPGAVLGRCEATVSPFSLVFQGNAALCAHQQTSLSVVAMLDLLMSEQGWCCGSLCVL